MYFHESPSPEGKNAALLVLVVWRNGSVVRHINSYSIFEPG